MFLSIMKRKFFLTILSAVSATVFFSCEKKVSNTKFTLFYPDNEAFYFVPVTKEIKELDSSSEIKTAEKLLEELKTSPNTDLRGCVPKEVVFSDINYDKEKKSFSLKFTSSKSLGDADEQLMLGCITNTLTNLKDSESITLSTNLKTDMDYSEAITKESYQNSFLDVDKPSDEHPSTETVYWYDKAKKYLIPVQVGIPKKDVKSLIDKLRKGPENKNIEYFTGSIPEDYTISIKNVNANHIDILIKSPPESDKNISQNIQNIVLLTIYDLKIFDTVKFINSDNSENVIDLTKINPKDNLNFINGS